MEKKLNAAVIGAGIVSSAHIQHYQKMGVDVVAIADPVEAARNRAMTEYGIPQGVESYKDLLPMDLDIVTICTPNGSHAEIAIALLKSGKHVICEKPMARTVEECDAMIAAAKESGKRLFIAHSHRFSGENIAMLKAVKEGKIGRPFMAMATFIGNEFERMNNPNNWKGTWDISGGGVLIDNGSHMINLLMGILGDAEYVEASCKKLVVDAENKAEDTAIVNIGYKCGALASVTVTFSAQYFTMPTTYCGAGVRTEIIGTEGAVCTSGQAPHFILKEKGQDIVLMERDQFEGLTTTEHFIDCIINNKEPIITAEDGRNTVAVIRAAYESERLGKRIYL